MKKENIIDNLLKEQESASNTALKNALARQVKEEQAKQEEIILGQFKHATDSLNKAVEHLRMIRAEEKRAKQYVLKINKALEQFKQDGNWQAFINATR